MFYCPNCKKKFRKQERKCPDCGGHIVYKENRRTPLIVAICILSALLIGLLIVAIGLSGMFGFTLRETTPTVSAPSGTTAPTTLPTEPTIPTTQPTAPTTEPTAPTTQPTTPTVPTNPTTPSTSPTQPSTSPSGSGLYTRAELEAMDKTYSASGFGAGRASNHQRPAVPVAEQAKYEQYGALFIGSNTKTVYLTFDCGYEYYGADGKPVTGKILDVLKEKNIKAVFFVTKDYVTKVPDLVQRMVDEGHVVGNHSTYHPVMPAQSIDRMEREITELHNLVLEKFGYKMTLFRPPTGAYSIQSLAVVQNLGYTSVLWSFQHYDYDPANQPSNETAYKTIVNNSHNGCIFLLHAVSEANAAVLGDVIDTLQNEQNYTIGLLS